MPHKRAKRSLRLAASEAKGIDNPPTAADSLFPITTTMEGKDAAGIADGEKRNKKRRKAGPGAGPLDTGGMSKSAFRILNAAKLRDEYHAKKKRKVEEETKGKNPNQKKKPSAIQPLPYESLSSFNHRVEQEMRHSVRTAIKDASHTAQKRKDRKGKAKQTGDEEEEEEEEEAGVDKNGKPVAKKAKPTPEESLDPFARPKAQREQQQLEQAKNRSGRTEFAAADLRRRIDDVVQAPPTLADPARKGLMQKVLGPGGAAACGMTSEGPGTSKLAGPDTPVSSSRLPINPAMKAMLDAERERAVKMYRQLKEQRDKERAKTG
ncbi:hypothetical protein Rt10032_c03g1502 [Rhodotorula toruloides]|uniref:Uncharacterized protein n=1 Tax=Rhodotorula toruloides TaxID=5286 RepID=A0A511KBZ3_RHOTO|nr:hypothetical protein Rt10032_c03g1502 [Rhodotorula toruloides]